MDNTDTATVCGHCLGSGFSENYVIHKGHSVKEDHIQNCATEVDVAKEKVIETILGHHNMPVMMKRLLERMSFEEILEVLHG